MDNLELSKKVKQIRSKLGLSQEQLAFKAELSLRTIQRIENGETVPRGDTLKRISSSLKVSPDELIDWQLFEDKNVLTIINLSQLSFIVFPLFGILVPMLIWISNKNKIKKLDELGKSILNFQLTWNMALFIPIFLIICYAIISPKSIVPAFEFFIYAGLLNLYNIIMIITNTIFSNKERTTFYKPALNILK